MKTIDNILEEDIRIAIIGLGYVGLPLAVEFSKHFHVTGFDLNQDRINALRRQDDHTQEADIESLTEALKKGMLELSSDERYLEKCNHYIITVPTPIDHSNNPDLGPLLQASRTIGKYLRSGDYVIYESTTYPGCTEEDCVPVLESASGLTLNKDFYCGYSPERINPGDKTNTLTKIKKVTSGSTTYAAEHIDALYKSIIAAGTHLAPSIKVAEASKAIENAQRDLNISFVNELSLIFDRIGIDTNDVLDAAATKWNFLKYKPGLVGGHCISVDPYYLAHKAKSLGYYPEVILSGRRVNNSIGKFIADKVVKLLIANDCKIKGAKVLILGFTFKENCPDTRNTKVIDIYRELAEYGINAEVCDPWADSKKVTNEYGIELIKDTQSIYDAIILAVAHDQFKTFDFKRQKDANAVIFDVKGIIDRSLVDARL